MIQCKKCLKEKPEGEMKLRGGKPSKVCLECDQAAAAVRASERERIRKLAEDARKNRGGARRKKKSAAARQAPRAKAVEPTPEEISVEPGSGFKAFLTGDDRLQIDQDNGDGTADHIVLSRTEFTVLTAQFAAWRDAPIK